VVSEELEKSLRAELNDHINSRMSGIQEEVARLQSQVNEAFTRVLERSTSQGETDTSLAVSIAEHIRAAHERGIEEAAAESARTKASSDLAILKAAVEELDDQRTQAGILDSLVNRAASFAPRVAFFVIKNEQATGWRGRGFEGTVGDEAIREISLPLASDTIVGDVARSRTTWGGAPGANAEDHSLLSKLGSEPPQRMIAIPLVVRDKSVAVLYADSAALDADAVNLEALETLVRVAGMAVELLSLSRNAARPQRTRSQQAAQPSEAQEEPTAEQPPYAETEAPEYQPQSEADASMAMAETLPTEEPQPIEEEAEAAEPAVVEPESAESESDYAAAPAVAEEEETPTIIAEPEETPTVEATPLTMEEKGVAPYIPSAPSWADTGASTDTGYQQATDSVPAATAAPPAPAQAEPYGARLGTSRRYGSADAELPIEVSEEERRLHNDARRFARLLVSEIKLYNEQKVKEGRTQGNIYERLREDIDRSRQMYDKRVAPPVAARYDYFHQELVNTLAEGDPAKLGDAYPGAAVSA
jgi:hypothetical protein